MTTHTIHNFDELHELIEKYDAWGVSLEEFKKRAGYRREGNAEYITEFSWGRGSTSLYEVWELVQYLHKHYEAKSQ